MKPILISLSEATMMTQTTTTMRSRAAAVKIGGVAFLPPAMPLTSMPILLEGGLLDGEERDLATRTAMAVEFSIHRQPNYTLTDRYVRTIDLDPQTGRTIFRHVASECINTPSPTLLSRTLTALRFMKPWRLVIGA